MTHSGHTPPPLSDPPPPNTAARLRGIALGFALGCLIFVVIRTLGRALLHDPCAGRTLLGLLPPLLLGPGGIAYATAHIGKGSGKAALGAGLALSSLFPALAFGVLDIGALRTQGCAGGYVVFSDAAGNKLPQLVLHPGQQATLNVRPGGFRLPQPVTVSVEQRSPEEGAGVLNVKVLQPSVAPGQRAALQVQVSPKAPLQQYTLTVKAAQGVQEANGQLTITVR